jgi:hypothetical protein
LWNQPVRFASFLQREPYEGQTPIDKTEVRSLFTKHQVYFGITCFDSNPNSITATELRRDVSQELDDYFEILIDLAHDRRNGYVFQVNPLGTQRDALIADEQITASGTGDRDSGWDGLWTSEARIGKSGGRPQSQSHHQAHLCLASINKREQSTAASLYLSLLNTYGLIDGIFIRTA